MANTPPSLSYRLESAIVSIPPLVGLYGYHSLATRYTPRATKHVGSDALKPDAVAAGTAADDTGGLSNARR